MRQQGFTLLEVLLSLGIISVLVATSIPVYESFVRRNDLDIAAQNIASSLRRAQTYARGAKEDNPWSVQIQSSTITLFEGTNYATRDAAWDEVIAIPGSITPSGITQVQFAELTAAPNTTGAITLTSTTNDTRTVTINAKGMVNY